MRFQQTHIDLNEHIQFVDNSCEEGADDNYHPKRIFWKKKEDILPAQESIIQKDP